MLAAATGIAEHSYQSLADEAREWKRHLRVLFFISKKAGGGRRERALSSAKAIGLLAKALNRIQGAAIQRK